MNPQLETTFDMLLMKNSNFKEALHIRDMGVIETIFYFQMGLSTQNFHSF